MPKDKAPAFQFYPKDFLTDVKVVSMSNTEVGIYIRLLCYCWLEGALPLETETLARMARMPLKHFTKLWENSVVKTCFQMGEDGRLHHRRLDSERDKQDHFRRRASDGGKAAVERRGAGGRFASTRVAGASVEEQAPGSTSSPISYLQSPISTLPVLPKAREPEADDDGLGNRARELLYYYPIWFAQERNGARIPLLGGPLQFQEAQTLCQTWDDDAYIEKLARLVLSTDDPFIAGTDRGWKIFVLKASWADDRLRQWAQAKGVAV